MYASENGFKVSVEDAKCVLANAFIQAALFQQFLLREEQITFKINLTVLMVWCFTHSLALKYFALQFYALCFFHTPHSCLPFSPLSSCQWLTGFLQVRENWKRSGTLVRESQKKSGKMQNYLESEGKVGNCTSVCRKCTSNWMNTGTWYFAKLTNSNNRWSEWMKRKLKIRVQNCFRW